jgi:thiamine biosynthesis lipoprotein
MKARLLKPVMTAVLIVGILTGCSFSEKPEVQTLFGYAMGTSYSVKVVAGVNEAKTMQIGIEGILSDINGRMSTYLPRSDLSVFAEADVGEKVSIDPKTTEVVSAALEVARVTEGRFDPTIAPLVELWGFGPAPVPSEVPSERDIVTLLSMVGYEAVSVEDNSLIKSAERQLDLSAIAKGYAVDEISKYLASKGFSDFLVEVGGEMAFSGEKSEGKSWRIAIEKPVVESREAFRVLEVSSGAIATSGDYRNFFELDGQRFSHTINPETGYPIKHDTASVTVVMESCMLADAFATAFSVMDRNESIQLAEELGIALFIIFKDREAFKTMQSTEFTRLFGDTLSESGKI